MQACHITGMITGFTGLRLIWEKKKRYSRFQQVEQGFKDMRQFVFTEFNSHKMQSITGTASQLSSFGMGGTKNIQKFGERLVTLGSGKGGGTANETIKKAGEWIQNHKTAANAISIVPGAIAAKATWDGSQKVVDKIGHTVDSGAYKYTDSKNQQIE